jgi:hypothetical protein
VFSLNKLAPVIPLGGMLMAAGYANRIYGVRSETDDVPDTYPLRFKLVVDVLCKSETRSGDLRDESCEPSQLRLKIRCSTARVSSRYRRSQLMEGAYRPATIAIFCPTSPAIISSVSSSITARWLRRFPSPFLCPQASASLCLPLAEKSAFMWPHVL